MKKQWRGHCPYIQFKIFPRKAGKMKNAPSQAPLLQIYLLLGVIIYPCHNLGKEGKREDFYVAIESFNSCFV